MRIETPVGWLNDIGTFYYDSGEGTAVCCRQGLLKYYEAPPIDWGVVLVLSDTAVRGASSAFIKTPLQCDHVNRKRHFGYLPAWSCSMLRDHPGFVGCTIWWWPEYVEPEVKP